MVEVTSTSVCYPCQQILVIAGADIERRGADPPRCQFLGMRRDLIVVGHSNVRETVGHENDAIDAALVRRLLDEEMAKIREMVGEAAFTGGKYREAAELFHGMITAEEFGEFLTLPAYEQVVSVNEEASASS